MIYYTKMCMGGADMSKVVLELLYARHGESYGNVSGSAEGFNCDDPPLTELGVRQAQLLGERLAKGELNAVFASPLIRAVHTAHEVAARQAKPVRVELLPDLMEVGTGADYTGCPVDVIKERFPLAVPCLSEPTVTGGRLSIGQEDYQASRLRAARCIDYFRSRFTNGEKILVVAHGGFTGFLMRCALGEGDEGSFRWSTFNTGLAKIRFYDDGPAKLSYSNDTSHLYSISDDLAFRI